MDRTTVAVYEARAAEWRDRRLARHPELARALDDDVATGAVRLDAGCGPGLYLEHLGRPVVALDASFAMVDLARQVAPDAWPVQGDLERLPFRRGCIGGSWARASYLHVPRAWLPSALMELHRALAVGAPATFTLRHGVHEGELSNDDFPGRRFTEWEVEPLRDVVVGAGFDIEEMEHDGDEWIMVRATRARTLPDFVAPDLRLLMCGLNPSLYAADAGVGFARPGNRFWPAALAAGLVSRERDPLHALRHHQVGMTDVVKRATVGADELSKDEYRDGAARVERLAAWLQPRAVCFVGFAGWRAAVSSKAKAGVQPETIGGRPVYLMPNPSGLNANHKPADFEMHIRAAMDLADASS